MEAVASDPNEDCLPAEISHNPERVDSDDDVAGEEPYPFEIR